MICVRARRKNLYISEYETSYAENDCWNNLTEASENWYGGENKLGETRLKMKLTKLSGLASGMAVVLLCLCLAVPAFSASDVTVGSPNGNVQIKIFVTEKTGLSYEVTFKKQPVIQASPLGIVVDKLNLGQGVAIKHTERYNIKESYPSRGVHSVANNHSTAAKISVNHPNSKPPSTLDVPAYNMS